MSNFKERFTIILEESGKSQEEFGKFIGISKPMVYHYKNGSGQPSAEVLATIADKCNVSMEWLVGRSDIRTPLEIIAAHRSEDELDLPPEALASIEAFKKEIRKIYGKK